MMGCRLRFVEENDYVFAFFFMNFYIEHRNLVKFHFYELFLGILCQRRYLSIVFKFYCHDHTDLVKNKDNFKI